MTTNAPPGAIMIVGALVILLLRGRRQAIGALLITIMSLVSLMFCSRGTYGTFQLFDYQLTVVRVDGLSLAFGYIFHIAAIIATIYALHVRDGTQHAAGLIYAGSAIGAVFAGDLITLFTYWEITAVSSVFLIWASRTDRSYKAGIRYLIIQVGSGVLLLSGVLLHVRDTGSIAFDHLIGEDGAISHASPGVILIFLAFGIKCAFPLLHNWLQDAYPKSTVTGAVFLSTFTTKLAVYALARGFAGTDCLIWIGVTMTLFPIVFAVIENDLRKVLAYSLNNQLGFMVVGIGIGSALSLNGTVAHAFCHILYKSLLFMSMGAVLYRTGTCQASKLGGLYKSMPITAICCIIGAASISAFPLTNGFVSKSLILSAAADHHMIAVWLLLLVASAGVMEHSGIKIPFFAFFAHDSGIRCKEAPKHMLVAMIIAATLCIGIGVFPGPLYSILPYDMTEAYVPYTVGHVVGQLQLLLFAMLAFVFLVKFRVYPPETPSENLDTDWSYRRAAPAVVGAVYFVGGIVWRALLKLGRGQVDDVLYVVRRICAPPGIFARTWTTSGMVIWATILLGAYLLLYYIRVAP
ncbi:MAG: Na(+)/H(+) antiporter subunit D [Phycisphaera sp.]|nr:Na(+)/H(+) antiporter subunit D [Phycisphaera sp.]